MIFGIETEIQTICELFVCGNMQEFLSNLQKGDIFWKRSLKIAPVNILTHIPFSSVFFIIVLCSRFLANFCRQTSEWGFWFCFYLIWGMVSVLVYLVCASYSKAFGQPVGFLAELAVISKDEISRNDWVHIPKGG